MGQVLVPFTLIERPSRYVPCITCWEFWCSVLHSAVCKVGSRSNITSAMLSFVNDGHDVGHGSTKKLYQ